MRAAANNSWSSDRLKDISAINWSALPANTADEFTFRYLEISNVNSYGVISEEAMELLQFSDAPSRARRLVATRDVLVSSVRPNLQAIAHADIEIEEPLVCSTGFNVVSPRLEKISDRYLYYFLLSEGTRQHFEAVAKGVGYPAIDDKDFCSTSVPLPPPPEQKRIAAYLDASCAAIDRAVETKEKQLDTLNTLRKSIIQRAVTQGLNPKAKMKESGVDWLGRVPTHWLRESLKRATSRIQTGSTPPTSQPEYYEEGTIEWFAPECFGQTINLRAPKKLINQQAFEDNKVRIFAPETVLFVGIGATIGKVAVLEKEGSANQQIVGISCDHRMAGRFLAYQLKNYEAIIPKLAQYTTLPILNQTKVGYLPVVRPPISEQQEICEFLDNKELELAKVEKVLNDQMATLIAYRKSLIHECVTGKRRVSDADVAKVEAFA